MSGGMNLKGSATQQLKEHEQLLLGRGGPKPSPLTLTSTSAHPDSSVRSANLGCLGGSVG